jgi:hypothetical protein
MKPVGDSAIKGKTTKYQKNSVSKQFKKSSFYKNLFSKKFEFKFEAYICKKK